MARGWTINYAGILADARDRSVTDLPAYLMAVLSGEWCDTYAKNCAGCEIVDVDLAPYHYLFDLKRSRVVAAYGVSGARGPGVKRHDGPRRRGWSGGSITSRYAVQADKGHFMSDAAGGGSDINLFVQRRDLNQGWSEEGKRYTKLEQFCQANQGVFCFSRCLYASRSDDQNPQDIEFGVLRHPRQFLIDVERFGNAVPRRG